MSNNPEETISKDKEKQKVLIPSQSKEKQDVAHRIFERFQRLQIKRNEQFAYFRGRTIVEYIADSNTRFNNYKVKPDWKEPWQSNISDITTHSKLMAIVAQSLVNRAVPKYASRFSNDIFSNVKADIFNNVYKYINKTERNGDIDDLFTILRATREGTVLQFMNYKESKMFKGMDLRFIPLDEAYPGDMTKFHMKDQLIFAWRFTQNYNDFKESHQGSQWEDVDIVPNAGAITKDNEDIFKISPDLMDDQVEKIILFNKISNEFSIIANGVLITKLGMKMTDFRKDGEMGIAKTVYEPYSDNFFYGRSLPDILRDNQDAIDFLFNAMFDKEILSVMRPILVGGVNNLDDKFWYPGAIMDVMDATQIKELGYEGPDINAFRVLKELQDRQHFASIDPTQQGISIGKKTATADLLAQEAAKKVFALFSTMITDFQIQKKKLISTNIYHNYLKNDKFSKFRVKNATLSDGTMGTQEIKITSKIPKDKNEFGFSKELFARNALIKGNSEIIEMSDKSFEGFAVDVEIDDKAIEEPRGALRKSFDEKFSMVALSRPDIFVQEEAGKIYAESQFQDPDKVLIKKGSPEQQQVEREKILSGEGGGGGIPSLKNLAQKAEAPLA